MKTKCHVCKVVNLALKSDLGCTFFFLASPNLNNLRKSLSQMYSRKQTQPHPHQYSTMPARKQATVPFSDYSEVDVLASHLMPVLSLSPRAHCRFFGRPSCPWGNCMAEDALQGLSPTQAPCREASSSCLSCNICCHLIGSKLEVHLIK